MKQKGNVDLQLTESLWKEEQEFIWNSTRFQHARQAEVTSAETPVRSGISESENRETELDKKYKLGSHLHEATESHEPG